jgi:sporulation protein YlmC with PRC-barrel domain
MRTTLFAAASLLALSLTGVRGAADEPARAAAGQSQNNAHVAVSHVFRTADIVGLNVQNNRGEKLGDIKDLVIDLKSGDVRYAALSFGGFAGFGDKLFAVPWKAMTFVMGEPNDRDARHFVFNVTKEQLDNAPGFDSSHWPNVADPKWSESIDKHYKVQQAAAGAPQNKEGSNVAYATVFRASKIKGMDVRNDADKNLGDIDDLVIDVTKGKVRYVALQYGSSLTGGSKLFAVPLSAFTLTHANDKTFLKLNVSQDALKEAPGFDKDHWPNTADPNWAKEIDTYYQRSAQRGTNRKQ